MKFKVATLLASLLLSVSTLAAPMSGKSDGFQVDFGKPIKPVKAKGPRWGDYKVYSDGQGFKGNLVYVTKSRKPDELLTVLQREHPGLSKGTAVDREVQGFKGLRWNGITPDGLPVETLIVQTPSNSYVILSIDFDTAEQKRFITSFMLNE